MVIDIILIILLALSILVGYKRGFIDVIARLVSTIIALILAYLLADIVGEYIARTTWGIQIENNVINETQQNIKVQEITESMSISETEDKIATRITKYIFTGIGFIIVFISAKIILWLAKKILEGIFELPILKTFNKLGGAVASVVLYLVEISLILAVIKSVATTNFMQKPIGIIQSSVITKQIYEHNIVTNIILSKVV